MASANTIKRLLDDLRLVIPRHGFNKIVEKTKSDDKWDYAAVFDKLSAMDEPEHDAIIDTINNTRTKLCGKCMDTWIPILDRFAFREAGSPTYQHTLWLPKVSAPCPNCSSRDKGHIQAQIDSHMSETERGWCYVILYDFYANALFAPDPIGKDEHGKPLYPPPPTIESFDPAKLWGLHLNPLLTPEQMAVMQWMNAKHVIPAPHAKMRPRINPMAAAEQFIAVGEKVMRG
jgi:hypothetical protein